MRYRYIYGPVSSWRLGRSLGIDPVFSGEKVCTFDCVYCQAGAKQPSAGERRIFVPAKAIVEEVRSLPPIEIDYITFSGKGEPTLAKNLGEMIKGIRRIRKERIAVITNASLMDRRDVRQDVRLADFVMAKLDAPSPDMLARINRPAEYIEFGKIIKGLNEFMADYKGRLALQIMFVKQNKDSAPDLAELAGKIGADEIQINTPLRPCPLTPLSRGEIDVIRECFASMNVVSLYDDDAHREETEPIDKEETLKHRGSYD